MGASFGPTCKSQGILELFVVAEQVASDSGIEPLGGSLGPTHDERRQSGAGPVERTEREAREPSLDPASLRRHDLVFE